VRDIAYDLTDAEFKATFSISSSASARTSWSQTIDVMTSLG